MLSPPPAVGLADLPGEIVSTLIGLLRDSRPLGLISARFYEIFKASPDFAAAGAWPSPTTPLKFCMQYTAEDLLIAGHAAGLAYWYRKSGIRRSKFIARITNLDDDPVDSAETAEWLYSNFKDDLVTEVRIFITLGFYELVRRLLPHATMSSLRGLYCNMKYKMLRLLWESLPYLRGELVESLDTMTLMDSSSLTFLSMNGINPIKYNRNAFCNIARLRAVKIIDVLECAVSLKKYYDIHQDHNGENIKQCIEYIDFVVERYGTPPE